MSGGAAPAVRVAGLSKIYGSQAALDRVNLDVAPGTIFGLVGPNGAGKTTLLSILAGLRRPSAGEVSLTGVGPSEASIGFMPDTPAYYPWLTGYEVIDLAARLRGSELRPDEISERLGAMGLESRARDKIGGYSRGMLQRLALAATLVGDPAVLLLDEPCSALDPVGRVEVLELIAGLAGRATVVFSTHLLSDVERVCQSVAMLDRGKVVTSGPIDSVRMSGTSPGLRLALEEPWPELAAAISSMEWCISVTEGQPGYYTIVVSDFAAARRDLLNLVAAWSAPVLEISRIEPSLEDVFLRVLSHGGGT